MKNPAGNDVWSPSLIIYTKRGERLQYYKGMDDSLQQCLLLTAFSDRIMCVLSKITFKNNITASCSKLLSFCRSWHLFYIYISYFYMLSKYMSDFLPAKNICTRGTCTWAPYVEDIVQKTPNWIFINQMPDLALDVFGRTAHTLALILHR